MVLPPTYSIETTRSTWANVSVTAWMSVRWDLVVNESCKGKHKTQLSTSRSKIAHTSVEWLKIYSLDTSQRLQYYIKTFFSSIFNPLDCETVWIAVNQILLFCRAEHPACCEWDLTHSSLCHHHRCNIPVLAHLHPSFPFAIKTPNPSQVWLKHPCPSMHPGGWAASILEHRRLLSTGTTHSPGHDLSSFHAKDLFDHRQ